MGVSDRQRWKLSLSRAQLSASTEIAMLSIIWTIIIGFVAGVIAKLLHPGRTYEPSGFIMTTVLGIVGAFVATYLGQAVGWYKAGESAGFIGAIVGAIIILVVWGIIAPRIQRTWDCAKNFLQEIWAVGGCARFTSSFSRQGSLRPIR
jgi:uncharacterized membrane protein YeaQ/YmgE (transglycosylase-associated protein family)